MSVLLWYVNKFDCLLLHKNLKLIKLHQMETQIFTLQMQTLDSKKFKPPSYLFLIPMRGCFCSLFIPLPVGIPSRESFTPGGRKKQRKLNTPLPQRGELHASAVIIVIVK